MLSCEWRDSFIFRSCSLGNGLCDTIRYLYTEVREFSTHLDLHDKSKSKRQKLNIE
jgi:hypothetical protein